MIRAHVPPFDTVSPIYTQPEKKVEPSRKADDAELTYRESTKNPRNGNTENTRNDKFDTAHRRFDFTQGIPANKASVEKSLLQEVLLAILQNPMTDINNIEKNISIAEQYVSRVSKDQ